MLYTPRTMAFSRTFKLLTLHYKLWILIIFLQWWFWCDGVDVVVVFRKQDSISAPRAAGCTLLTPQTCYSSRGSPKSVLVFPTPRARQPSNHCSSLDHCPSWCCPLSDGTPLTPGVWLPPFCHWSASVISPLDFWPSLFQPLPLFAISWFLLYVLRQKVASRKLSWPGL